MIDFQEVIEIHQVLVNEFGGLSGIRDENALKSALTRPFSGFGTTEFYPTIEEKVSAVIESIVKNHPFVDGNKRTGYVIMRLLLMQFGKDLHATQDEKYNFVIAIASGELAFQEIVAWVKEHVVVK
jgi:death-on-curing protein